MAGELTDKTEEGKLLANKDLALRKSWILHWRNWRELELQKSHEQAVNTDYVSGLSVCSEFCFSILILDSLYFWVDVMMSARTLIHLFRSLNPEMLQKKFRVSVVLCALHIP